MRVSSRLQVRWGLRLVYVLGCCIYAGGFLLWGLIDDPTILSFLTMLEGVAFGLLFTTSVVVVGRLMPATLYSTANSMREMVMLGIGPILGAGIGGFVYQRAGHGRALRRRLRTGARGSGRGMVRVVHTRAVRTRRAGAGDRTRRHVTEADEHRAFLEHRWPELGVRTFEPIGGGWDCFTYLVNGEWVFQFPRLPGAAESLAKQIAVLPELAREVSSAIPSPGVHVRPIRCAWATRGSRAGRCPRTSTASGRSGSAGSSTTCT